MSLLAKDARSLLLVFFQFFFFFGLFYFGSVFPLELPSFLLFSSGLLLGLWAVLFMKKESILQITPNPLEETELLRGGPYRYVRHPMYTSLLLLGSGVLWPNFELLPTIFFACLFITLLVKSAYEEAMLLTHFENYTEYRKSVKRLIPFIW